VNHLAELEEASITAEGAYKGAYARSYASGDGSIEDRKQAAVAETLTLWTAWQHAAAAVRLQRESIKALTERIGIGRTIHSTARTEMQLAGVGDGP
jgi:hypothetical protein